MKLPLIAVAIALFAPLPVQAAPTFDITLTPGRQIDLDLGCSVGAGKKSRWPTTVYDQKARERITWNISACTGGYIRGVNEDTGRVWNAEVTPNGSMYGRDLDGAKWRYDARTKTYTNLATGRTCGQSSLRHVCAA